MSAEHPIFVVGSPRTGTTLMKDILNRHPEVHLFNEVHFFERLWDQRERLGDLSDDESLKAAASELHAIVAKHGTDAAVAEGLTPEKLGAAAGKAGGGYGGLLQALLEEAAAQNSAGTWGDSSPQDVLYLDVLFEFFPGARVVAMVRDPRAFLASYKNYHRRAMVEYAERYNPLTNSLLWSSYMKALLESEDAPYGDAVCRTRYEDLVEDPEREVRRICAHAKLDYHPPMLEIGRANSSYAPGSGNEKGIYASSKQRWREELSPTDLWLVERVCGATMERFGYERVVAATLWPPSPLELLRILATLPARLFNMLFRGRKRLRLSKLKRVVSLLRAG